MPNVVLTCAVPVHRPDTFDVNVTFAELVDGVEIRQPFNLVPANAVSSVSVRLVSVTAVLFAAIVIVLSMQV